MLSNRALAYQDPKTKTSSDQRGFQNSPDHSLEQRDIAEAPSSSLKASGSTACSPAVTESIVSKPVLATQNSFLTTTSSASSFLSSKPFTTSTPSSGSSSPSLSARAFSTASTKNTSSFQKADSVPATLNTSITADTINKAEVPTTSSYGSNSPRETALTKDNIPTSPTATPTNSTSNQNRGYLSTMYSSNNDNNSNGVLRSPSVSSASGSGSGSNDASTSISSATTIITNVGSMTGGLGGSSGVSDVKLKRFLEHNQRLKEQLEMRRITVSEASQSLIKFVTSTKDSLMPNQWGNASSDPFLKQSSGCCTVS